MRNRKRNDFYENENIDSEVHNIMALFRCNEPMARTIIESSQMNGQIDSIKKMCRDHNRKENSKNGW